MLFMILTLTLNPSIDYLYTKKNFYLGVQNRFTAPVRMIGGKGINAGRTASILGSEVSVTGVLGGNNGQTVTELLKDELFTTHFFSVLGETRNAITIMHDQGQQTEIVEEGPKIDSKTEREISNYVLMACQNYPALSTVCLSGSVNSENEHLYQTIIEQINDNSQGTINILADISGNQLKNTLREGILPFFIKPNLPEFSDLIEENITSKNQAYAHLAHPLVKDVPLLLITCGEEGAIAKYHNVVYDLKVPQIDLVNPTGSGDATVGGIAYALDHQFSIEDTLRYGMACGVANAMEEAVGFVNKENVAQLVKKITLTAVKTTKKDS